MPPAEKKDTFKFSLLQDDDEAPDSPHMQKRRSKRQSVTHGNNELDEVDEKDKSLKQFTKDLQQRSERSLILLTDRLAALKAKVAQDPAAVNKPSTEGANPRWNVLVDFLSLVQAASYQVRKMLHAMMKKKYKAPMRPSAPFDADDALASLAHGLSTLQVDARELCNVLQKYAEAAEATREQLALAEKEKDAEEAPTQVVSPMKGRFLSKRGSLIDIEERPKFKMEDIHKGANEQSTEEILGSKVDLEELYNLPSHFDACLGSANALLRAFNPVVSLKVATGVVLAAARLRLRAKQRRASLQAAAAAAEKS